MKKSVLFYLPKINSYIDRVKTIAEISQQKINFVFIENDNKIISKRLMDKGHNVFFISDIIKNKFLRLLLNPIIIVFLTLKTNSQIVHLTSYVANPLLIKLFCSLTKKKYIVSLFCLYSSRYETFKKFTFYKKIKSPQIRKMYFFTIHEYLLLPCVDNLIMQSHGIADSLPHYERYKHKIKVIPNAIEINHKFPKWLSKNISIKERPLNLLYAGGIEYSRGTDILINTFNELCDKEVDTKLTLIGQMGDYFSEKLNFHKPNKVQLLSKLKREDFHREVLKHDIFIYPSKNEGSPRVVLEMLSIGIPIFATNLPGIVGLDKKKEFINFISDKESIIKKIEAYINDPSSFYLRSIKGRNHIRKYNSTKYVSKAYEKLYS